MADMIIGNTELGATKQAIFSELVQRELAQKAILMQTVMDLSIFAEPGASSISFPKVTSFEVQNRAEGVAGESQALTATMDQMLLDWNAYVSWVLDKKTAVQSKIPAQKALALRAAAAQARYVDSKIIAKIRTIAASFVNVGANANVTYDNLIDMLVTLDNANAVREECSIVVSPTQYGYIRKLPEFKNSYQYGQATLPTGVMGYIEGVPVIKHNGLASSELFIYEKSGIGVGFQTGAEYGEQDKIEYGVGAKLAAVDQLFGVTGLQLGMGGASSTKSPLVVGLND